MLRRNVLIFHSGALGDFLITWPIALAAARVFPQSRVIFVTAKSKGALAEKLLRVESIDTELGWHELFSESPNLPEPQAKTIGGAHTIVSFLSTGEDRWASNARALAPEAQLLTLQTNAASDAAQHVTEHLIQQIPASSPLHEASKQMLKWVNENGLTARTGDARKTDAPILIHPGAGAARKCWPMERFDELAQALAANGRTVQFVLGEVERDQWPREQVERVEAIATIVQPADLLELHATIARAAMLIGNDSGPAHLSGICGVPTIALFAADPARWRPLGPRVSIIRGKTMEEIKTDEVLRVIQSTNQ